MIVAWPPLDAANNVVRIGAGWIGLILESIACAMIAVGAGVALSRLIRRFGRAHGSSFTADRLVLARYLAWALEFQLADDILQTAISPSWRDIGELAAIATIRTALNFSLGREMKEERERLDAEARKSNTSVSAAT